MLWVAMVVVRGSVGEEGGLWLERGSTYFGTRSRAEAAARADMNWRGGGIDVGARLQAIRCRPSGSVAESGFERAPGRCSDTGDASCGWLGLGLAPGHATPRAARKRAAPHTASPPVPPPILHHCST